jgi:hypothetical protein
VSKFVCVCVCVCVRACVSIACAVQVGSYVTPVDRPIMLVRVERGGVSFRVLAHQWEEPD